MEMARALGISTLMAITEGLNESWNYIFKNSSYILLQVSTIIFFQSKLPNKMEY
jgi:hypothetical protein